MNKIAVLSIFIIVIMSVSLYPQTVEIYEEEVKNNLIQDNDYRYTELEEEQFNVEENIEEDRESYSSGISLDGTVGGNLGQYVRCELAKTCEIWNADLHTLAPPREPMTEAEIPDLATAWTALVIKYMEYKASVDFFVPDEIMFQNLGSNDPAFQEESEGWPFWDPYQFEQFPIYISPAPEPIATTGSYVIQGGVGVGRAGLSYKFGNVPYRYLYFNMVVDFAGDGLPGWDGTHTPYHIIRVQMPIDSDHPEQEAAISLFEGYPRVRNRFYIFSKDDVDPDVLDFDIADPVIHQPRKAPLLPQSPLLRPLGWDDDLPITITVLSYYETVYTIEDALDAIRQLIWENLDYPDVLSTGIYLMQDQNYFTASVQNLVSTIMYVVQYIIDYEKVRDFLAEHFDMQSPDYATPSNIDPDLYVDPTRPVDLSWYTELPVVLEPSPIEATVDHYEDVVEQYWEIISVCISDSDCDPIYEMAIDLIENRMQMYIMMTLQTGVIRIIKYIFNWINDDAGDGEGGDGGTNGDLSLVLALMLLTVYLKKEEITVPRPEYQVNLPTPWYEYIIIGLLVIVAVVVVVLIIIASPVIISGNVAVAGLGGLILLLGLTAASATSDYISPDQAEGYSLSAHGDTDGDNLPDGYELRYGSDPTVSDVPGPLTVTEYNIPSYTKPAWSYVSLNSWTPDSAIKHEGPYSLKMKGDGTTRVYDAALITMHSDADKVEAWAYTKYSNYGSTSLYLKTDHIDPARTGWSMPIQNGYILRPYVDRVYLFEINNYVLTSLANEVYPGFTMGNKWIQLKLELQGNELKGWITTSSSFTTSPQISASLASVNHPTGHPGISARTMGSSYPSYFDEMKVTTGGGEFPYQIDNNFDAGASWCYPTPTYVYEDCFDSSSYYELSSTTYDGRTVMRSVEDYAENTYNAIEHNIEAADMEVESWIRATNQYKVFGLGVRLSTMSDQGHDPTIPHSLHVERGYYAFFYKSEIRLYRAGAYNFKVRLSTAPIPTGNIASGWNHVKIQSIGNMIKVWHSWSEEFSPIPNIAYDIGMDPVQWHRGVGGIMYRQHTSSAYGYTYFDNFRISPVIYDTLAYEDVETYGDADMFRGFNYVELTENDMYESGGIYTINNAVERMEISFRFKSSAIYGQTGADAIYTYFYSNGIQTTEDGTSGYIMAVDFYSDQLFISYDGVVKWSKSVSEFSNGAYHTMRVVVSEQSGGAAPPYIELWVDNIREFTASILNTGYPGSYFGIGARTGSLMSHNQIYVINMIINKMDE